MNIIENKKKKNHIQLLSLKISQIYTFLILTSYIKTSLHQTSPTIPHIST